MITPTEPIGLEPTLQRRALDRWLAESKRRMGLRFPAIDFLATCWPIRSLYQTQQLDLNFTAPIADLAEKDRSYVEALRCLVAEMVIAGKPKQVWEPIAAYRQLAKDSPHRLFDLTIGDLRRLEERLLAHGKTLSQRLIGVSRLHLIIKTTISVLRHKTASQKSVVL